MLDLQDSEPNENVRTLFMNNVVNNGKDRVSDRAGSTQCEYPWVTIVVTYAGSQWGFSDSVIHDLAHGLDKLKAYSPPRV